MGTTSASTPNNTVSNINIANSNFSTGTTIRSAHIIYLSQLIRDVSNHTHTLTDYSVIHTYGDIGSSAATTDTVVAKAVTSLVSAPIGTAIQASNFNKMRTDVATIRSHNHAWTDN